MRLTTKRNGKNVIPLPMAACGIDLPYWRIDRADDLHSYLSGDAADKLAAYEDAEEQGRLVILPCKVGDTVFVVEGQSVYKSKVDSIMLRDDGLWLDGKFNHFGLVYFSGEIGRNVFFTREEAKAALKQEVNDEDNT